MKVHGHSFTPKKASRKGWYVEAFWPATSVTTPLSVPEIGPWNSYSEALAECQRQARLVEQKMQRACNLIASHRRRG